MNFKKDQMSIIIRESQWGGGFYGYRLTVWLFYGYRFQLPLTKKLNITFFCFKKLNIH